MFVICYKEDVASYLESLNLRLVSTPSSQPYIFALIPDFDFNLLKSIEGNYYMTSHLYV